MLQAVTFSSVAVQAQVLVACCSVLAWVMAATFEVSSSAPLKPPLCSATARDTYKHEYSRV